MCRPIGVGFLRRFGLESGMVFEGTDGSILIVSVSNEQERKKNVRIRNGFEEFVCLRANLSNDNIISA